MLILPAVDIMGGRCVRLEQGDPKRSTVYYERPLDAALRWAADGAKALHVVDLDGALMGSPANTERIAEIVRGSGCRVEVGGGVRDVELAGGLFAIGADRVVVGTRALQEPEWLRLLCVKHPRRIVVAIDARDGKVATHGWKVTSDRDALDFAVEVSAAGAAGILYTDIARDGMLTRPNFSAIERMVAGQGCPVIASGGVGVCDDIRRLGECGAAAVIVGRAIYTGGVKVPEALEIGLAYPSPLDI
ncbi:MAG TPA: 1-(5-phosphoribosyl)-5-[(5-phosphoribosylamino)methylideneamino]imidazole-4-carboxamide isomerase [Candidatus Brocadiia bacterium]|nr:1-(5-phosphoribosyl)-5-[(5-phosphoribosylamino)methylideneamino]imidazole-4-carboxamide isomerase [Candidatus Brocadiia bacterium]